MASLDPASKWLSFGEWLQQQRSAEGTAPDATSTPSDGLVVTSHADSPSAAPCMPTAASAHTTSSSSNASSSSSGVAITSTGTQGTSSTSSRPPLRTLVSDCRMETRVAGDCARARQEPLVMLAAPGMPLHRAPVLTARQAQALMAAVSAPLVSINVGRLTRKLTAPTKLEATEARGQLSLWLVSLFSGSACCWDSTAACCWDRWCSDALGGA